MRPLIGPFGLFSKSDRWMVASPKMHFTPETQFDAKHCFCKMFKN